MGCGSSVLQTTTSQDNYPAGTLRPTASTNVLAESLKDTDAIVPITDPMKFPKNSGDLTSRSDGSDPDLKELLQLSGGKSDSLTPNLVNSPITEIFSMSHIGAKNMMTGQAFKAENQDVVSAQFPFHTNQNLGLFCVYDGHGSDGLVMAKYCNEAIIKKLKAINLQNSNAEESLKKSFISVQRELAVRSDSKFSGATASVGLMIGGILYFAHVGDSRGVVVRSAFDVEDLGHDHRPDYNGEKERIEMAGGRIVTKMDADGRPVGPPRVYHAQDPIPGLMLSRSLGDSYAHTIGVSHIPEIVTMRFDGSQKYIVIASDGVWDVLSSKEVGDITISSHGAEAACNAICAEALVRWESRMSADNIGVVVVKLY